MSETRLPEPAADAAGPSKLRRIVLFVGAVMLLIGVAATLWQRFGPGAAGAPVERTFDGPSKKLTRTVVVPTLDTPIPEGKSAIWCSTFQIAWKRLADDVNKGPVVPKGAEEVAARLNNAGGGEADLEPESYYAAAGLMKDGIVERIRREMAAKFPEHPLVDFTGPETVAIAYAYLAASLKFTHEYVDLKDPMHFVDLAGGESTIRGFGIPPLARTDAWKQADVLFDSWRPREFAVDPDRHSKPYQVVLAQILRPKTLGEAVDSVSRRIARRERAFAKYDVLRIPYMSWKVEHSFNELTGAHRPIMSGALREKEAWLSQAYQSFDFKMNNRGVELRSDAKLEAVKGDGPEFSFDRPFLILLRKRGSERPFFAMWVDNDELLAKR